MLRVFEVRGADGVSNGTPFDGVSKGCLIGSTSQVFEFRGAGRWVATHKTQARSPPPDANTYSHARTHTRTHTRARAHTHTHTHTHTGDDPALRQGVSGPQGGDAIILYV